ncbi:MAG: DUF2905 domain-containing protein [Spirochaetes bacterium]|nr:DUF2905 domain-containing protein [Spirochaetota bacterium]
MHSSIGKSLIIAGIIIAAIGLAVLYRDSIPFLKYLGKLPGDIRVQRERFSFSFPITTSIILSILLSLIIYCIQRFRG